MAFVVIYDSETKIVKSVIPGVSKDFSPELEQSESVMFIKDDMTISNPSVVIEETGEIMPYIEPPSPEEIKKRRISRVERAVQRMLDDKAREYGYDNILSACSYAGCDNHFMAEGQAFTMWRGAVWKYCYDQLADIEAGNRSEPASIEEFLSELPQFVPPAQ